MSGVSGSVAGTSPAGISESDVGETALGWLAALARLNPDTSAEALYDARLKLTRPEGTTLVAKTVIGGGVPVIGSDCPKERGEGMTRQTNVTTWMKVVLSFTEFSFVLDRGNRHGRQSFIVCGDPTCNGTRSVGH